ncbi:MAG: hypothetical protein QXI24_00760 [Acidilobaceae archaeon]
MDTLPGLTTLGSHLVLATRLILGLEIIAYKHFLKHREENSPSIMLALIAKKAQA